MSWTTRARRFWSMVWKSGTTAVQGSDENTAQCAAESALERLKGSHPELASARKATVRYKLNLAPARSLRSSLNKFREIDVVRKDIQVPGSIVHSSSSITEMPRHLLCCRGPIPSTRDIPCLSGCVPVYERAMAHMMPRGSIPYLNISLYSPKS